MGINGYIWRKSYVHSLNPVLKIITFIMMVVLVFLNGGFLVQIILLGLSLFLFLLAKLPYKIFSKILVTYILMFFLLLFINWLSQKSPIATPDKFLETVKVLGNNPLKIQPGHVNTGHLWSGLLVSEVSGDYAKTFSSNQEIIKWINATHFLSNHPEFHVSDLRTIELGNNVTIGYFVHWYALSSMSIFSAFYISTKLLIVILASSILTSATSTIEMTYALEDLLMPLKILRLPINEMAMMISIALRFVPSLINESFRIMKAQASRGIDFKNGKFHEKINSLISLVVPLFTIAFIKADDLANAMSARSYNPRYSRSRYRTFSLHFSDLVGFLIIIIVFSFLFYYSAGRYYFSPFGIVEALTRFGI